MEDDLVTDLMETAVEYLDTAGVTESWNRRYSLAVQSLTLHWYDHRDDVGADKAMPLGLRALINQLKAESFVDAAAGA